MKKSVRILIVEDKPDDADLAKYEIRRILDDCEFQVVETRQGFIQALEIFQPDVILSEYTLPRFDGIQALQLTLQHAPLTPLIIWTGSIREDAAVECVKAGASNYILKENLKQLGPATLRALEEKELLAARKQADRNYQSIFENSMEGIFQSSPEGRYLSLNPAMARLYGYASPREMIESIQNIATQIYVEPEKHSLFVSLLESQNSVENFEARNYRKDGSIIWTSTSARIVQDQEGKILYYEGFLQDISQRKRVEEDLQNSEKRFRALIENGLDDISLLALDGTLLWESPSTIRNLGYAPNEYVGRNIFELMHPEDLGWTRSTYGKLLKEPGSRQRGIFRLRRADGAWRWVEAIASNMLSEPGVNAIVINYHDITEQKQAGDELQRRNADLALINALNELVNRGEDLDVIVDLVRDELKRIFSSEYTNVYLLDHERQSIQMQHYSLPPDIIRRIEKVIGRAIPPINIPVQQDGFFQRVLRAEQGMIISGPEGIQRWMAEFIETVGLSSLAKAAIRKLLPQIYRILNIKSTVLVPLISDGKPLGLLNVSGSNVFTEQDLERIEKICGQLTTALRRKQVEEALRESRARYQSLVETSHDLIWSVDAEGKITFMNRAARDIYGYEPEELVGRSFTELLSSGNHQPSEFGKIKELIGPADEFTGVESLVLHRDGRQITLSANSKVLRDEQGHITGITGSSHDITARKQAEETLKEERNLLRTLIDNIPDRIYAMDMQGRKTLSNTADWKASGGKTMEDVIGKTDFDTYPPELAEEFWKLDRAVLDSGQPIMNYEEPGLDFDGNPVSILTTKIPLRDEDGTVIGLVGIGRDITERKQTEEALRQSQNRYRTLVESQTEFIVRWSPDGRRTFANEAYSRYFGLTPRQALYDNFIPPIHEQDRPAVEEKIQRLVSGTSSIETESHRVIKRDGTFGWQEWTDQAIRDENGNLVEFQSVGRDITERRQVEMERQALLEIMQGLANTKDLQELLKLIHGSIAKVIFAENFFVILRQPGSGLFEEIYTVDQYDPPAPPANLEDSITSYVFRSGEPLLLTRELFEELAARGEVQLVGTDSASWLGVPLKTSGRTIGVMAVQDYENTNRYSERDKDFLASIATQAALAIERKLAEEALRIAEAKYRSLVERLPMVVYASEFGVDGVWTYVSPQIQDLLGFTPEEWMANSTLWYQQLHPADRDRQQILEEQAYQRNEPFIGEYRMFTRDGSQIWVRDSALIHPPERAGAPIVQGILMDITERKQAEEEKRRQTEARIALYETTQDLVIERDLSRLLHIIVERAARLLNATGGGLYLCEPENEQVRCVVSYNTPRDFTGTILKYGEGAAGLVAQTGEPLIIDDYSTWQGQAKPYESQKFFDAVLSVPITWQNQVVGVLHALAYGKERRFSQDDLQLIVSFANQAAIAIQNARLYTVSQQELAERQRAERALRESEERFSSAFEYASIGIALVATDGHWLRVNWALSQLIGYSEQELISKTFQDITHPEDLETDLSYVNQLLNGDIHSYQMEKRYFHKLGHAIWILLSVSLLRDNQGNPLYFIAQIQDITERKRAEESLRAERKKAEKYLEIAGVMMLALDREGTVTLINQKGCEILGYPADDIIGKNWIDTFLPAANREEIQDVFQKLISDEVQASEYYENSIVTRSGEERLIAWHNTLLRDEQGRVISSLSSGEDITERKRAEAELRASEERFRQLADNIQEAFWMTDAENGQEIYMSPAAERIWGRSIQNLMYEPNAFINTVFSEDRPVVLDAIERQKRGEGMQLEYRIVRPDGTLRWIWDRAFPIFDDTGKVRKIAGISADISERRESELALVKSQNRYRELFDSSPLSIWEEDYSLVKKQIDSLRKNGVLDLREYLAGHPEFVKELASMVRIIDVNKASLELYGIDRKEDLLLSLGELLDSTSLQHFADEIIGLMSPLKRFSWEGGDVTKAGSHIEVMVNGSIPHGYEEDWSKVIVSIIDITERKLAEQELRKLSRAVEQTGSTIVITDTSGIIEYVNPKFTQTTGYSYEEVVGQNPRMLKSGFTADEEYKNLWETIKGGGEWHGELLNKKKNGTLYWESVTISPILNERQEITHYVGVKEDITERKQSEIEIRRHVAELEAVYENGLSVGRLLEPGGIGDRVIETFARYLPWHHVTIRLRKEGSDDLELVSFNLPNLKEEERSDAEQHFVARINKVGQGLSGWVLQTGMPLRTDNVHAHPQYIDTHAGIQSGLYMPLKVGERVIGVISVESEAPKAFTEQDERLLATLANQTAIAFENARLYEAMQAELLERKRVEDALRVSETHYRALADSITDILFELDQDLHYTHWNKASETFTGIPASQVIGRSMEEILGTTDEQIRIRTIYEDVVKSQRPRTFETILGYSGERRFFDVNAYPSTRGVSVVAKDVTDRKRTETIMQKRFELMEFSAKHSLKELMLRTVDEVSELTGSTIGFFNFMEEDELNLGVQTWSTNALQLFQVSPEDGAHRSLDRAGVWAEAVRQRRPLIHNNYESLANRKGLPQGHVPILRQIVIPIIRNERIMAVLGIANKPQDYTSHDLEIAARLADYAWDITERKQMEIALQVERNQLVERVEERTADLSRANSNLARALRVKDEFLANMSHELRTPLNAILGLSESLGEQIAGPLNEKQQKYISTISESGHHLLSLINDILDLAKIEAGQITLDINKVDIHSVCQASLRMIKQLAQKRNQDVSLQLDPGMGLMWADERRLKQMIVNLLGNAVKFTPENGKLGLEVHGDEEANQITITVWDNGIGIKREDLTRLFQPFVQLDSGLAREAPGTGLGLALVAQMARLHGGSVNVESEPGKGSRFTLVLPWEPALALDAASRMRITGKFRAIQFDATNKPTILLVEDTKEVVMMLKDYLELAGYKVFTAQDGIDGIVQARHVRPDLILMDVQMPHMDGFETTRKLRSDPNFRYTPIIALTALAMPHDRERCLEAGMDEYISKPVNLKTLVRIIQSCLFEQESRSR
jgi:PAS domain S-box-containing protein